MTWLTVPVIDIAPFWTGGDADKRAVARQMGAPVGTSASSSSPGARRVAGAPRIRWTRSPRGGFFDRPLTEKMRVARPARDVARGYIGLAARNRAAPRTVRHGAT